MRLQGLARNPARRAVRRRRLWRGVRRWFLALGIVVAFVVGTGGLLAWRVSRLAPAWWRQTGPVEAETAERAESLENGLVSAMHRADRPPSADSRPGHWRSEPWRFSITAADANAWLNMRLWKWLANQDARVTRPDRVREIQVDFEDGVIRIGVRVQSGERERFLSAGMRPRLEEGRGLRLRAESLGVGRLDLPAPLVLDEAHQRVIELTHPGPGARADLEAAFASLDGQRALPIDPVVRLSGGRRVRILELRPHRGRLEVTCRTEHVAE